MTGQQSTEQHRTESYEVVVIGGGAAGLSAALILGRARCSTLVIDAGEPRNAPAAHMQGYLSRDGMPPAEFLAVGRAEIARYGVELVQDRAVGVTKGEDFAVTLAKGDRTVHAKRLVIATGLRDELPAVPGVAERFGRDVIHCPFCHGWEVRDQTFGVLASTPASVHQALLVTRWSKDVTLFLHTVTEDDLTDDDRHRLGRAGVTVVPGEVESLTTDADRLTGVRLTNGTTYARETLFVAPRPVPRNALFESSGAELTETPFGTYPKTDATGLTTVPGVWAAGNAIGFGEQVIHAASGGYRAATAIVADLMFG